VALLGAALASQAAAKEPEGSGRLGGRWVMDKAAWVEQLAKQLPGLDGPKLADWKRDALAQAPDVEFRFTPGKVVAVFGGEEQATASYQVVKSSAAELVLEVRGKPEEEPESMTIRFEGRDAFRSPLPGNAEPILFRRAVPAKKAAK
jgi:hypothetical protein